SAHFISFHFAIRHFPRRAPLQQDRSAGERLPYNFFRSIKLATNSRVYGATSDEVLSASNSLRRRRKLSASSTSYPLGRSLTSSPISVPRFIVWLSTRSVLQSTCSNKCRCGFFTPIK